MLWAHCRDIRVEVYQTKVIYNIPLYGDKIFKNAKIDVNKHEIILTTFQEPTQHHLEVSSYDNPLIETERPGGNDKYSQSHQLVCREMK